MADRVAILRPLRIRDYRLLWIGFTISLLGDGVFPVALAWQVYRLSNVPTALAVVGLAWTLPQIPALLVAGVVSDRVDRRIVLVFADVVQGLAVGWLGYLTVVGAVRMWHVAALAVVYGIGEAFFGPASQAIVPELIPEDLLVRANSLQQFVRPMALNLIGPALGGVIVGSVGAGWAFILDALSFAVSAGFVLALGHRRESRVSAHEEASVVREAMEGLRFVRQRAWLWGAMLAATVMLLVWVGPMDVLVPYLIKNSLGGSARDLGLVFAAGGVGAIAAAGVMGQGGLPRRPVTFMYLAWTLAGFALAGFALVGAIWQAMLVAAVIHASIAGLQVTWVTLLQRLVPGGLLGRVSSLDWMISTGLVPLSFAITGPLASAVGARTTLALGGLAGGTIVLLFFALVPGIRAPELDGSLERTPAAGS